MVQPPFSTIHVIPRYPTITMNRILAGLLLLVSAACSDQQDRYRGTVRQVFVRSAQGDFVSDSLLLASYPQSAEEYRILREVMKEVPSVSGRDDLIEDRIRSGNLGVLEAHLAYAALIEGEEAMWYVENLDPMLAEVPLESVCEVTAKVVSELGRERLQHIAGLVGHCQTSQTRP